ncbi:iron uptake cluster protein [Lentinus tigrinus ALCF2SS1-7]|uniref:iron uptake cluster protein n=1 Tax=Lentinus tigrinus ALCF2SS1-7 TaxID=1328758 RepID=UPI001165D5FF|nr:iron uptake cluster protein [Lentinus tigrinus ALCF2SS1-7]
MSAGQSGATVAVLGASYGGARAACILAQGLPEGWRVVLVDRNDHMNHLYVLPRFAVLPGHEHKAFIPYNNVFAPPPAFDAPMPPLTAPLKPTPIVNDSRQVFLHASITSLSPHSVTLDRAFPEFGVADSDRTLHFDYLVYALGSHLPSPINLWGPIPGEDVEKADVLDVSRGTKRGGVAWLKRFHKRVERASSVLVVGGGALGIQFATDIAEIYPTTKVTLLHSRTRLLPRFDEAMHSEIVSSLSSLNVCTILGDRLDLSSLASKETRDGERVVRTQSGREISAELVLLCTGQTPNTALLRSVFPNSVHADGPNKGMASVRRTLQLAEPIPADELPDDFAQLSINGDATPELAIPSASPEPESEPESPVTDEEEEPVIEEDPKTRVAAEHVFAVGDAADAFGAVNAGHNAFFQGQLAAHNIIRMVKASERDASSESEPEDLTLEKYAPGLPSIKVSLGLNKSVYQFQGMVGTKEEQQPDLDVHLIWRYYGFNVEREDLETDFEAEAGAEAAVAGA